MMPEVIVTGVLVLAVLVVLFMAFSLRKRGLKGAAKRRVWEAWRNAESQQNPVLRVVEADKVLDEALRLLGFGGTLGEKLKKAGPRFSDLNGVWWAHKLRNSLVHDLSVKPSESDVARAMSMFKKALADLGMHE